MDVIVADMEHAVDQKSAVQDILTAGLKTAEPGDKNRKKEKDAISGSDGETTFSVCLKECVGQVVFRENGVSGDLKAKEENRREGMDVENAVQPSDGAIIPGGHYLEVGLFQIRISRNPDPEDRMAMDPRSGMTNGLSGEQSSDPVPQKNSVVMITADGNHDRDGAPGNFEEAAEANQNGALPLREPQIIRNPGSAGRMGPGEPETEVIVGHAKADRINADFGVGNISPAKEVRGGREPALSVRHATVSPDSFPSFQDVSRNVNAQEIDHHAGDVVLLAPDKPEAHLEKVKISTESFSREPQSRVENGHFAAMKTDGPLKSEKLTDPQAGRHSLDSKQGPGVEAQENPPRFQPAGNQDGIERHGKRSSQELKTAVENMDPKPTGAVPFLSVEDRSHGGESEKSVIVQPQVLMDQIAGKGTEMVRNGGGRIRMTLNPPNLGSLDMDIQVRNNKVDVVLVVDRPEIQSSLQANADLLKSALSQQGLKVDGYNILLQGNLNHNMDHHQAYYSGEGASWRHSGREGGHEKKGKDQQEQGGVMVDLNEGQWPASADRHHAISLFI